MMVVYSNIFKLITNTFPPDPRGIWWTGLPHTPLRLFCYSGDTAAAVATRALLSINSTTSRRTLCTVCALVFLCVCSVYKCLCDLY